MTFWRQQATADTVFKSENDPFWDQNGGCTDQERPLLTQVMLKEMLKIVKEQKSFVLVKHVSKLRTRVSLLSSLQPLAHIIKQGPLYNCELQH